MNSKVWFRKALSMCLVVATIATYSMVALAGSERVAGELLITGKNSNGESPYVKVNGEAAQNGRSIFSSSIIATPENADAVINLGKLGKIELAPNSTMTLTFDENGINGDLIAPVTMELPEATVELETAGCPLTVTCPVTVISPIVSPGAAIATIEKAHHTATTVRNVIDFCIKFLPSILVVLLRYIKLSK